MLHQNFEERNVPYADTFTWEGKPFEVRPNQSETVYTRRKRAFEKTEASHVSSRKEETEMGALIIAKSISVVSRYLGGPARRPFLYPRSLYVIAILDAIESNFGEKSEGAMVKLWKDYGIADAILITPCNGNSKVFLCHLIFRRESFEIIFFAVGGNILSIQTCRYTQFAALGRFRMVKYNGDKFPRQLSVPEIRQFERVSTENFNVSTISDRPDARGNTRRIFNVILYEHFE